MNLFWLNALPIAAAVAAWAGIPLWMVARHPNWSGEPALPYGNPELDAIMNRAAAVAAERTERLAVHAERELAGVAA